MLFLRQAIVTTYHGPSNVRGSRVKARSHAKSIYLDWDDALDIQGNHAKAAQALQLKEGLTRPSEVSS